MRWPGWSDARSRLFSGPAPPVPNGRIAAGRLRASVRLSFNHPMVGTPVETAPSPAQALPRPSKIPFAGLRA